MKLMIINEVEFLFSCSKNTGSSSNWFYAGWILTFVMFYLYIAVIGLKKNSLIFIIWENFIDFTIVKKLSNIFVTKVGKKNVYSTNNDY